MNKPLLMMIEDKNPNLPNDEQEDMNSDLENVAVESESVDENQHPNEDNLVVSEEKSKEKKESGDTEESENEIVEMEVHETEKTTKQPEELNSTNLDAKSKEEIESSESEVSESKEDATENKPTLQKAPEKKEIPVKDYSKMDISQLTDEAVSILNDYPIDEISPTIRAIRAEADKQFNELEQKAKEQFIAEGGDELDFDYHNQDRTRFNSVIQDYRNKKRDFFKEQEREQNKNLERRLELIEELKNLYQHDESVDNIFKKFREIKAEWSTIGYVPRAKQRDVYNTYHHHLNNFYEYLDFNKELREKEYAHNLEMRQQIIEEARRLTKDENIGRAFNELQYLHKIWKEDVGPVDKSVSDSTWDEFKELTSIIHDRRHGLLEENKAAQDENLEKKNQILEQIKNLTAVERTSHKEWRRDIKKYENLREEFISIKNIPRSASKHIWKDFKEVTREFNHAKNNFYKDSKREQKDNLQDKMQLVERAKELSQSEDWDAAAQELKEIQNKWKTIGHVPRSVSDKIWNEFRGYCNTFFDRMRDEKNSVEKEFKENTDHKRLLLEEIKSTKVSKSKDAPKQFEKWIDDWNSTGKVIRSKRDMEEEFKLVITEKAEEAGIPMNEINEMLYKKVVTHVINNRDLRKLMHEKNNTRKKIDGYKSEVSQLENNMSFFSNADESNPMLKHTRDKIEELKNELEIEQTKYDYLVKVQKEIENEEKNDQANSEAEDETIEESDN